MRPGLTATLLLMAGAATAPAHRLDEYLQGTLLSVERNRMEAEMTLTPGVAVFPFIIPVIDTNADGVISEAEQRAYASRVLRDLSLTIDGHRLTPRLLSLRFPAAEEMKEGRGEIRLGFDADLPSGGRDRKITLENAHLSRISAYQVNCLIPRDPEIRVSAQIRNYTQSQYRLDYVDTAVPSGPVSVGLWQGLFWWAIPAALFARLLVLWRGASPGTEVSGPLTDSVNERIFNESVSDRL